MKLFNLAKKYCNNTLFVSSLEDVKVIPNHKKYAIGIASGASTPREMLSEFEKILKNIKESKMMFKSITKEPHVTYEKNGVIEVTDLSIITIGGNTSAGSSVVPNGGGVYRKTYARAGLDSRNKYFMPDYSILSDTSTSDTPTTTPPSAAPSAGKVGTCTVTLGQFIVGSKDPEIKTIQIILNGMGYKGKDGKALTVDGDLGENTAYAITNLQKAGGMKDINFGTVAAGTWKLLLQ